MDSSNIALLAVGAVIILALVVFLVSGYVKAPPNKAFIISGMGKKRTLVGRAGFRIPFFERIDKVCLEQIGIDIKTNVPIPTQDFINISVDAVAKIQVSNTPEGIEKASVNFLNKNPEYIANELKDSFEGNLREIVGSIEFKALNGDRDAFSDQVMKKAGQDMEKMGIEIISCNIQNITDEEGLIRDLGAENTSKIRMSAQINKADADAKVAIAQAEAKDKANEAEVKANEVIAKRNNSLIIKQAELKQESDTRQAQADTAYDIQKQDQLRELKVRQVNASIAEKERMIELGKQEAEATEKRLDAVVRRQADAEKYRKEQEAEALLFTMDGTPCNCTGSPILSKKAHSFRGGMNCDQ